MTFADKPSDETSIGILKDEVKRREAITQRAGPFCVCHDDAPRKKRVAFGQRQLGYRSIDK
jgi:hypothetical protein